MSRPSRPSGSASSRSPWGRPSVSAERARLVLDRGAGPPGAGQAPRRLHRRQPRGCRRVPRRRPGSRRDRQRRAGSPKDVPPQLLRRVCPRSRRQQHRGRLSRTRPLATTRPHRRPATPRPRGPSRPFSRPWFARPAERSRRGSWPRCKGRPPSRAFRAKELFRCRNNSPYADFPVMPT